MNNKPSTVKAIEQGRANFAYEKALEAQRKFGIGDNKYKSYVKRIPMLIKTNGLGATLAYIKSKIKKNDDKRSEEGIIYDLIYTQLTEWLHMDAKKLINSDEDLVKVIISLNSAEYRAVTNEVLAFLSWLRRFAEGLMEGDQK